MENWSQEQMMIVDKALLGEASESELRQLDLWIKDSPEFSREYDQYKEIHNSLSDQGLQEFMDEFQAQHQSQSTKTTPIKSLNWYWIVASIALLVAIGWWLVPGTNLQDVQAKYAMKNDQINLTTASTDAYDRLMAATEMAYNNGRYEKALILLDSLQAMDSQNLRWELYKGMTLFQTGEFDQARSSLSTLMKNEKALMALREESSYWLALTHLAQGNVQMAKSVIEDWSPTAPASLSAKSRTLLEDLKSLD